MPQGLLRQLMVVQPGIAHERRLQFLAGAEVMGSQDIRDPAIEALHHAVGLGRPGLGQTVFDAQGQAKLVEFMVSRRLAVAGAEQAIREFLAVVGQDVGDASRTGFVQGVQEGLGGGRRLVGLDGDIHPARGPVDGHEQVAPAGLVDHLGQVLHIHMQVARFVGLEWLRRPFGRLGLRPGRDAVPGQTAVQGGAGQVGVDEFPGHGQEVVQGQPQGFPDRQHHGFLGGGQGRLQAVRGMGAVFHRIPVLPAGDGFHRDPQLFGQCRHRLVAGLDHGSGLGRRRGVLVQSHLHRSSSIKTSRARNIPHRFNTRESSGTTQLAQELK